jgi:DegV family protein with EDD domain
MAIKLVVDSTADLTRAQVEEYGITVIPLNVHFGEELYKDGVDITAEEFFKRLPTAPVIPRTSQPSAGEFVELYKPFLADGHSVISIHLSSRLSGTIASAQAAKSMLEGDISLVDTKSASQGVARIAIQAARAVRKGKSKAEVLALVEELIPKTQVLFAPDTLEYLQKNGRIGRAQALLGSLLKLKPILGFDSDGVTCTIDKVRGRSQVIPRVLAAAAERLAPGAAADISVIHGNAPDPAKELYDAACGQYAVREGAITCIGPVIGSHGGPGILGLVVQPVLEE